MATMLNTNSINIFNLVNNNKINNNNYDTWLDVRDINNQGELSKQYSNICQEHLLDKKWILMINPENKALDQLSKTNNFDCSKILKVNASKVNVDIDSIGKALQKGNCAAIILCNASLRTEELSQLSSCAQQGKTQCIVLKNSKTLH